MTKYFVEGDIECGVRVYVTADTDEEAVDKVEAKLADAIAAAKGIDVDEVSGIRTGAILVEAVARVVGDDE